MRDHSFLDYRLLTLVRSCAKKVAAHFKLRYRRIDLFPIDDPDRKLCRGMCYPDGFIYVNLRHKRSRKFDPIESAIDTVIHELTHLKHDLHNKDFWATHTKMKRWFMQTLY